MSFTGKKILVTGHNGFLGKNIVNTLNKLNAEILTLTDGKGNRIDIRDWKSIKESLQAESVDVIYHLAAETFVPSSYEDPRKVYEVNLLGTLNILELARIINVKKIIYTSSYVYGTPQYLPIDEKHPINPNNPYSRSKLLAEQLLDAYYHDFGLKYVVFRPFNIYGRGQSPNFLIPAIVKQLKNGKIILKDCKPRRDFIHVQDVVEALIVGLKLKKDSDIFNIGCGKSYSVREIVNKIIHTYGKPVEVICREETRRQEVMDTVANIQKAKDVLGWQPHVDIDKGLADVVKDII